MDPTEIRPEYAAAVRSAEWGFLGCATLLLPAFAVWSLGLQRWVRKGGLAWLAAGYAIGVGLYAPLAVANIYTVQAVKKENMVTRAEMTDWASDTYVVFAPLVQPIVGVVYCGFHLVGVVAVGSVAASLAGTKRSAAEFMQ